MRCFVAAFVAADSARALHELARELLGPLLAEGVLRLLPMENLHVTLRFLGEVDAGAVAGLEAAVAALEGAPSRASVTSIGGFPEPACARLVAAELAPQAQLAAWARALGAAPGAGGCVERGFRPHVTLARSRRSLTLAPLAMPAPLWLALQPPALYRSDPSRTGMVRYRKVAEAAG